MMTRTRLASTVALVLVSGCVSHDDGGGAGSERDLSDSGGSRAAAVEGVEAPARKDHETATPSGPAPSAAAGETTIRVLENAAPSEWELAERVLVALKSRDAKALEALRITEKEYRQFLFPEFPAARGSIPVDFHWFHLDIRSHTGVREAIERYGGKELELLDVIPTKGIDKYATYEIWSKVELVVRFADGRVEQIRIFGSVVHLDGQFKILAFPT